MPRDKKAPRLVGLTSPRILVPAIAALAIVGFLLVWGALRGVGGAPEATVPYEQFEADVRGGQIQDVQMYRDVLVARYQGGKAVRVQDVSPEYTIGLLRKNQVPYDGLPEQGGSAQGLGGVLVVLLLPYLFLGWLTVMMVRAAGGAADPDVEALNLEAGPRCPDCSRPVGKDARFCQHCAHPVQWTGQVLQCPGCGQQVWKADKHCRGCGKALPAPAPSEARKPVKAEASAETAALKPPASGERRAAPSTEEPARRERPSRPPTPGPLPGEKKS